jgi:phosphoglycerol transferase MdoB-like AlkP superfamily enzyme
MLFLLKETRAQVKQYLHIRILTEILIVLLIFQAERILFFCFNFTFFTDEVSPSELLLSFIHGIRFDLSILLSANALWYLLMTLPYPWLQNKLYQQLLRMLFYIVNIALICMNLIDVGYFKFTGKRTGPEILSIRNDVGDQIIQIVLNYFYLVAISIVLAWALIKSIRHLHSSIPLKKSAWYWHYLITAAGIICMIFGIRGGSQYKPLKPDHAFVHTPNKLGHLVLNTPYNFFTTLNQPQQNDLHYFTDEQLVKNLLQYKQFDSIQYEPRKLNVVLIIMESFAAEYSGLYRNQKSYMPFFDSLAKSSTFFPQHYANGRRSIDAVPALLAAIPGLMYEPYITGIYQSNELHGLPELLVKNGYTTHFFHGGKNGTMGFDKFSLNAGVQHYYGLNEYPEKEKDSDGNWGIYDEPFLLWMNQTLSKNKQPFFATVFTLSSHQPYSIPTHLQNKFPKGNLEIHESIGYADYALRNYFNDAKKQPWYDNTIFILTADHTQEMEYPGSPNVLNEYLVPLVFFKPGEELPANTDRVSQHCDVPHSIADLLGIQTHTLLPFGESLFQPGKGKALHYSSGEFRLIHQDHFLVLSPTQKTRLAKTSDPHQHELLQDSVLTNQMKHKLTTYLQFFNNGLNHNSWYHHTEKINQLKNIHGKN